jgi:multidrug resistance protein, MATE family
MSTHERTLPAGALPAPGFSLWRAELTDTVRLATPIALTQLGQIAMMTTDLMLLGRLGAEVVAAAALAHTVLFAAFTVGMGLVAAVAPLGAQAFGARDPRGVRRSLRVGMWASMLAGVPLTALQFGGTDILQALGQTPENAALAWRYLMGLGWCLIPAWVFMAIRGFMGAVNRPEPALWITLTAIPANLVLAWALIYGELGLPRLDLLGAGIATTLVNIVMCAAALVVCVMRRPFKKYRVISRIWRFDAPLFRKLLVVGLPISGAYLLEFGVFAAAALLMGTISTTALAAHQIALQIAAVLFMVPFGISIAATVRVGHAVGRRDAAASRRAGFAALALGALFMAIMTSLVALARDVLPIMFLGSPTPEKTVTFELTATLLLVGMFFFIADGLQTVAAGALRGLNDTRVPLLFATFSFWVVGFSACWWLGFQAGLGAVGVWIGLTVGIMAFAILLVTRFHVLTARGYMPEVAASVSAAPH